MSFISDLLIEVSSFRIKVGEKLNTLANRIGTLANLTTTNKTNLVDAVNEINNNIPKSLDFITTNTNQTGLSGNKTTSGNWQANYFKSSRLGYFGSYNSSQTQGIWSIGEQYNVSSSTND